MPPFIFKLIAVLKAAQLKLGVLTLRIDNNGVLFNKLGIIDPEQLTLKENKGLLLAYKKVFEKYSENHVFSADDIRHLHTLFLNHLYHWAGEYRTVDISSEQIRWCHARFIEQEMGRISKLLSEKTPFSSSWPRKQIIKTLAEIHAEIVLIHPFRDGNGRITRLLCDLLLFQAGYDPIRKGVFYNQKGREQYFAAIREAWTTGSYSKLCLIFDDLVSPKP